jgi:hypothetical protein
MRGKDVRDRHHVAAVFLGNLANVVLDDESLADLLDVD